jgi:hypothetical protein
MQMLDNIPTKIQEDSSIREIKVILTKTPAINYVVM